MRKEQKRGCVVNFRVSVDEFATIRKAAVGSRARSVSEFCRESALIRSTAVAREAAVIEAATGLGELSDDEFRDRLRVFREGTR